MLQHSHFLGYWVNKAVGNVGGAVYDARPAVLNLWVRTHLGRLNNLFTGVVYQVRCISDTYTMVHNGSNITVVK